MIFLMKTYIYIESKIIVHNSIL